MSDAVEALFGDALFHRRRLTAAAERSARALRDHSSVPWKCELLGQVAPCSALRPHAPDWQPHCTHGWQQSLFRFEWSLTVPGKPAVTHRVERQLRQVLAQDVATPASVNFAAKLVQRMQSIQEASLRNAKKRICHRSNMSFAKFNVQVLGQPLKSLGPDRTQGITLMNAMSPSGIMPYGRSSDPVGTT